MGSEKPDVGSERPDLGSERLDLGSGRPDLGSEWPDLGSERPDLGSETAGLKLVFLLSAHARHAPQNFSVPDLILEHFDALCRKQGQHLIVACGC